jgi:ABC-type transport system involved in multi-copper enzyme maturation permease subunit
VRLLGPVYFKELFQLAQSRRLPMMKGFFLATLFLFFLLIAIEGGRNEDEFSLMLYFGICAINAGAILLFAPIFTASAVSGEREANTLRLLFLTRLSAWNIVQDKGLSRMTLLFFMISLTFPILASTILYGGVETRHIVSAIANLGALALLTSGFSILFSTIRSRFSAAVASTYLVLIVYLIFLPLGIGLYMKSPFPAAWVSPFMSVGLTIESGMRGMPGFVDMTWKSNLALGVGIYLVCTSVSALLVRRLALADEVDSGPANRGFKSALFRSGYVMSLMNPLLILKSQYLRDQNPLSWQYGRVAPGSTRHGVINLANGMAMLLGLAMATTCYFAWRFDGAPIVIGLYYGLSLVSAMVLFLVIAFSRNDALSGRPRVSWICWTLLGLIFVAGCLIIWLIWDQDPQWARGGFRRHSLYLLPEASLWYASLFCLSVIATFMSFMRYQPGLSDNEPPAFAFRFWTGAAGILTSLQFVSGVYWAVMLLDYVERGLIYMVYVICFGVTILVTVLLTASTFSRERQLNTLPILLSTCLHESQFITGVLAGLFRSLTPVYCLCVGILVMGVIFDLSGFGYFTSLIQFAVQVFFALSLTLLVSLKRSNTGQAIMISLAVLLCLYLVVPIIGGITDSKFYMFSPSYLVGVGLQDDLDWEKGAWWFNTLVLYLPASMILFSLSLFRFNEITGRQPEWA